MTKEQSNLNCPSEEDLASLLDGKIAPEKESLIDTHVTSCSLCESKLAKISDSEHLQRWRKLLSDPFDDSAAKSIDQRGFDDAAGFAVNTSSLEFEELVADLEAEGFRDLRRVGIGGMGQVFSATQEKLDRRVAIKVLFSGNHDLDRRRRFQQEAKAISDIDDERVLKIHGSGEVNGRMYLILELVDGPNLGSYIDRQPQDPKSTAKIVHQISCGVAAAHQRSIVHRDIKPANILLKPNESQVELEHLTARLEDYSVRVADFGLAKAINPAREKLTELTQTHQLLGTPAYMSPEQIAGHRSSVGYSSDVYSIGVLMYEMLTGDLPFNGKTPFQLLKNIETLEPISPRRKNKQIPVELESICLKCIEKKPQSRYRNAQELQEDLNRYFDGMPIVAKKSSSFRKLTKWAKRKPSQAILAATVLIATAAMLIVWAGVTNQLANLNEKLLAKNSSLDKQREITRQINRFLQDDILKQAAAESQINWLNESGTGPGSYIRNPSLKNVLDRVAQQLRRDINGISSEPIVAAELLKTVGETYRSLGDYDAAIDFLERALRCFPADELESIAVTERELALSNIAVANFDEARSMLLQSKQSFQKLGPSFSTQVHLLDRDLAEILLLAKVETDKTIEFAQKSYDGLFQNLGANHPDTLLATSTLGRVKLKLNQNEEALRLLENVSEQTSKSLGDLHPGSIDARFQLARARVDSMQFDEGYALFEQVWQQAKSTLGDGHPTTIYYQVFAAKNNWANLGRSTSPTDRLHRNREAVLMLEKAREQFGQLFHPTHPIHLEVAGMLSEAYTNLGEYDKLIELCTDAIARLAPLGGHQEKRILSYQLLEARAWMAKSKLKKAINMYVRCLEDCKSVYGENHELTSDVVRQLGRCYVANGEYELAVNTLKTAYWKQYELYGTGNTTTLQTGMVLLNCYNLLEEHRESEKLSQHLLDNLSKGVSSSSVLSLTLRKFFAISIFKQGRSKDAEPLLRQIAGDYQRIFPDRYQVFQLKTVHAASLRDLNFFDEAETVALGAWEGINGKKLNFPDDEIRNRVTKETAQVLVSIYNLLEDTDSAKKWQLIVESID